MKKLPIGIQTFDKLIKEDYLYVDKTRCIYDLITRGSVYFLSRPRRFGKSLLISTLDQIFKGNKEIFKSLWIYDQPWEWKEHPIIRIDFSILPAKTSEELEQSICVRLKEIASRYGIVLENKQYALKFSELIQKLAHINKVVILIDEYDKPILDHITDIKIAGEIREVLKKFYTMVKGSDEYLRFVFLTGVSKFSKVGVFSGLNNLNDITMNDHYTELLGYTQDELETCFSNRIDQLAEHQNKRREILLTEIKQWYNGYRFSGKDSRVYNPFSTLLLFDNQKFTNYWFETGTPTFLLNLIKEKDYDIRANEAMQADEMAFTSYEVENLRVEPLLYQTGYLTITDYEQDRHTQLSMYTLGYPNFEVKNAFLEHLVDQQTGVRKELAGGYLYQLIKAINANDLELFFTLLRSFFANIPYDLQLKHEKYYQTIFYLVFTLLGLRIQAEVKTNQGRADAVVETTDLIYIFEFKLFGTKEEALQQIKDMKYDEPHLNKGKDIILVGVEFNAQERNIGEWMKAPI